jgi:hypothetical protein
MDATVLLDHLITRLEKDGGATLWTAIMSKKTALIDGGGRVCIIKWLSLETTHYHCKYMSPACNFHSKRVGGWEPFYGFLRRPTGFLRRPTGLKTSAYLAHICLALQPGATLWTTIMSKRSSADWWWWKGLHYNFTSLSFDVNILVLCTIFIKFFTNSTSFIPKYMLKTTITMDGVFFVLDCVRCQWTKLCWNESCVWQRSCSLIRKRTVVKLPPF